MRLWLAISIILLVPASQAAGFDAPAHAEGDITITGGGWLLGAVEADDARWQDVLFDDGRHRVRERLQWSPAAGPAGDAAVIDQTQEAGEWTQHAGFQAAMGNRVAFSIWVEDGIVSSGAAAIDYYGAGDRPPDDSDPWHVLSATEGIWSEDSVVGVIEGTIDLDVQIVASEWWGLSCAKCPRDEEGPGPTTIRTLEIDGPASWTVRAVGTFVFVAPESDWRVDGALRLTGMDEQPGATTYDGTTDLRRLAPLDGRLQAQLSGSWQHVFQDEQVHPAWIAGGGALALIAVGLIAREILAAPLDNEKRRMIYRTVQERPGLHFRELQRATGRGNGALVYSLRVLAIAGLIRSTQANGSRFYYATASVPYDTRDALIGRFDPAAIAGALRAVAAAPVETKSALVSALIGQGASRSAAYRLVSALENAEILVGPPYRATRIPSMLDGSDLSFGLLEGPANQKQPS